ncbi:MAG: hypothetical protein DRI36_02860 [Caldiserica bacterium]|nr:MAG: hypothetical protein DRI36_02860 [Caldisericota bacterium]
MRRVLFLILLIVIKLGAIEERTGEASMEFLNIREGTKEISLGIEKEIEAGKYPEIGFTYKKWIAGMKYQGIKYSLPINRFLIGCGITYFDMGEIKGRDEKGERTGNYRPYDIEIELNTGYRKGELTVLNRIKYIKEKIKDEEAEALAMDIYLKYWIFQLGIENIGGKVRFIKEKYSLPLKIFSGLRLRIKERVKLVMDITREYDGRIIKGAGIEWKIRDIFYLRTGYRDGMDYSKKISFGIGIKGERIGVDYAYIPEETFGNIHQFSINFIMGKGKKEERRKELLFELGRTEGIEIEKVINKEMERIVVKIGEPVIKVSTESAKISWKEEVMRKIIELVKKMKDYRITVIGYYTREEKRISEERVKYFRMYLSMKTGIKEENIRYKVREFGNKKKFLISIEFIR